MVTITGIDLVISTPSSSYQLEGVDIAIIRHQEDMKDQDPYSKGETLHFQHRCHIYLPSQMELLDSVGIGDIGTTRRLLDEGYNPNYRDEHGQTPIMLAGNEEMVNLLLDSGADIDAKDKKGWTSLMHRVAIDDMETVLLLLRNNADPDVPDNDGWTPLIHSSYQGNADMVELLLDYSAGKDLRNSDGWTALMRAAYEGDVGIVTILLDRGADPNVRGRDGERAIDLTSSPEVVNSINSYSSILSS